MIYWI